MLHHHDTGSLLSPCAGAFYTFQYAKLEGWATYTKLGRQYQQTLSQTGQLKSSLQCLWRPYRNLVLTRAGRSPCQAHAAAAALPSAVPVVLTTICGSPSMLVLLAGQGTAWQKGNAITCKPNFDELHIATLNLSYLSKKESLLRSWHSSK